MITIHGYKTNSTDATQVETLYQELRAAQKELHDWGCANQVAFDPGKEEFVVIRRRDEMGNAFRLLCVDFDP